MQPYHTEVGAGTFNPATFLRCLDARPWRAAYVEPSMRPTDGRYGENPYRLGHYFQYQVVIKPSPPDIQDIYLQSLVSLGIDLARHDVRFVEDNWEGPTLGAWGQGWEVWADGMEITQFTYFQQLGGFDLDPITIELTYGLERIAMYLQGVDSVYDIVWSRWDEDGTPVTITYGDVYRENERQFSRYNFEIADTEMLYRHFDEYEAEADRCLARGGPAHPRLRLRAQVQPHLQPARRARRDQRHDRTAYIARVRDLARKVAALYLRSPATASASAGTSGRARRHDGAPRRDRLRRASLQESASPWCASSRGRCRSRASCIKLLAEDRLLPAAAGDADETPRRPSSPPASRCWCRRVASPFSWTACPSGRARSSRSSAGPRADIAFDD